MALILILIIFYVPLMSSCDPNLLSRPLSLRIHIIGDGRQRDVEVSTSIRRAYIWCGLTQLLDEP